MEQKIKALLARIVHPESGRNIVESGMVEHIDAGEGRVTVTLRFEKARDPFALKIKRQVEEAIAREFSLDREHVAVIVREAAPKAAPAASQHTFTGGIGKVLAVASGKGGVGKSTVTANLALTLRNMGYRVGILDADIYGPSQPKMFGVEGYLPDAERIDGEDCILPADAMGIKLMSIGFFIKPSDALIWRDAMATNALRQMIHQTKWGGLDFLLVDLPPGTGGVHLAVISELKVTGAVIVSTPQQVAVADVRRGVEMFRADKIEIPVVGIIENMAWFTPKELPENRYYIFGHGGARAFAEQNDVPFLGDIPIVQSVMDGSEEGRPAAGTDPAVESLYRSIAEKVVENMAKTC